MKKTKLRELGKKLDEADRLDNLLDRLHKAKTTSEISTVLNMAPLEQPPELDFKEFVRARIQAELDAINAEIEAA